MQTETFKYSSLPTILAGMLKSDDYPGLVRMWGCSGGKQRGPCRGQLGNLVEVEKLLPFVVAGPAPQRRAQACSLQHTVSSKHLEAAVIGGIVLKNAT